MRTVVYDGWCYRDISQRNYLPMDPIPSHVSWVLYWAEREGIDNVWMASSLDLDAAINRPEWWDGWQDVINVGGMPTTAFLRVDGRITVRLMRSDDSRWGIEDRRIAELTNTLRDCRELLGRDPTISPASWGLAMLRNDLARRGLLEPSPWTCRKAPPITTVDIAYLNHDPAEHRWLHVFDRNGAYLSAARNSDFGVGEPVWRQTDTWDSACFAAWHISDWDIPAEVAHLVPLPAHSRKAWVMTPVMAWLDELGVTCKVQEVCEWPSRRRLLRPWADRLTHARSAEIGPDARAIVKRAANLSFGVMAHERKTGHEWHYRPEWRAHIMAVNAVTFARRIRRLELAGYSVVAAYIDMIAVLGDAEIVPELAERPSAIGHYKLVQTQSNRGHIQRLLGIARDPETRVTQWLEACHVH